MRPLEWLGDESLKYERPLIDVANQFLDNYFSTEDDLNDWKWMIYLSS